MKYQTLHKQVMSIIRTNKNGRHSFVILTGSDPTPEPIVPSTSGEKVTRFIVDLRE